MSNEISINYGMRVGGEPENPDNNPRARISTKNKLNPRVILSAAFVAGTH